MFTIMRNTFYTRVKLYSREAPGSADCVAVRPSVGPTQEWSIRGAEVRKAINRLSPCHREVLMLVGVLGVSYEETAQICGCAMGTVKSRLNRARLNVLEQLGEASAATLLEQGYKYGNPEMCVHTERPR
jgi:RNA polymerase sigma-70 factor (ECF subfamily)